MSLIMDNRILGIDVSRDSLVIFNRLTHETISIWNNRESIESFSVEFNRTFAHFPDWKVGIESTGDYSLLALNLFSKLGFSVMLLNPVVTRKYIKGTVRGKKTDESDAEIIALALANGEWVLQGGSWIDTDEKKVVMRSEQFLVRLKSDVVRHKKSLLLKLKSREVEDEGWSRLKSVLRSIENLETTMESIRQEIEEIALDGEQTSQEQLIDSIPGFAEKLSCIVSSELGDVKRFPSPKQLRAFMWLDPKVKQSGTMNISGHMTKHGNPTLRWALFMAAQSAARCDARFHRLYEEKRLQNKSHRHCLNIIASKLCGVIHWVVTQGTPYIPQS